MNLPSYPIRIMPTRAIYLAKFRHSRDQRAHFAIFIPALTDTDHDPNEKTSPCVGTLINVVGTPMTGFVHEIRATYPCRSEQQLERFVRLGVVDDDLAPGTRDGGSTTGNEKKGKKRSSLVEVALQILPPWRSENFLAPVDDVSVVLVCDWMGSSAQSRVGQESTLSRMDNGVPAAPGGTGVP